MSTLDDDYRVVRHRKGARRRRRNRLVAVILATAAMLGVAALVLIEGPVSSNGAAPVRAAARPTAAGDESTSTAVTQAPAPSTSAPAAPTIPPDEVLPESGSGRRVVFSVDRQRMWWVDEADAVLRTALVSGRPDTPSTGTFRVYSKTLNATGLDGSRMDYFVRFTKGPNGWAIGFHDIPTKNGSPVQTEQQLGEPLSHGCIRQSEADATFTWDFLEVGDTVVVVT